MRGFTPLYAGDIVAEGLCSKPAIIGHRKGRHQLLLATDARVICLHRFVKLAQCLVLLNSSCLSPIKVNGLVFCSSAPPTAQIAGTGST